jgi:two-component system, sensor histidine kinase LadS
MRHCLQLGLLLALLLPALAAGQAGVQPMPPDESLLIQEQVESLADPTKRLTMAEVWQRADRFRPVRRRRTSFGVSGPPQWLRMRVSNQSGRPMPIIISLDNPLLDDARFFVLSDSGRVLTESGPLDWTVPVTRRPVAHRKPALQHTLPPGQTRWVYARIFAYTQPLIVRLQVLPSRDFDTHDRRERLLWNGLLGVFGWLVVVGCILFALLGERVYGVHALNMLFIGMYLMAAKGFFVEWFPGTYYGPLPARYLSGLMLLFSVLSTFLFIREYVLRPAWQQGWIRRLYYAALVPLLVMLVVFLFVFFVEPLPTSTQPRDQYWIAPAVSIGYAVPILLLFGLCIWRAVQERAEKPRNVWLAPAHLYLLSATPLVVHILLGILYNYAILTNYPLLRYDGIALAYLQGVRQQLQLQQQQNQALQAQLRLQQEKERIARDLHDNVGAQLSVIASSLDHIRMTQPLNGSATHLEAIGTYAREAIGSLRETIWAINTEHISIEEFRLQLQQYLNRQQTPIPAIQLRLLAQLPTRSANHPQSLLLNSEQALNLFRITQEAVQNAIKHAHAEQINVRLETSPEGPLHLSVEDDGMGFDMQAGHPGHYGLLNMRLRAERLGGRWQVSSIPGQGTTLFFSLPLKNTEVCV